MTKLTESAIETFAIEQFEQLGYQYVHGPSIAPDSETPERDRWDEVLLPTAMTWMTSCSTPLPPANNY